MLKLNKQYQFILSGYVLQSWFSKTSLEVQNLLFCLFQLYMYQLFRSLAYIHSLGICHRDIKPQNLLLDPETAVLKLCDFGSAKQLLHGEPNVSYICSRYYRAPELIFGAINYTTKIGKKKILSNLLIRQKCLRIIFFLIFIYLFTYSYFFSIYRCVERRMCAR